ncbi:hypothetical protein IWQ60_012452 [Tieghemiomyces parasiticus]|uniref:Dienelactone hydrolase domain-containing protein n=1 Tax=Tieghemiomyces parasiticus TaxID=78921 RepID=A0A9W8DKQ5_9FUNG|nr:hypothetical protein IWQ60_012452 [Tieghemiomyces parasiticus]
MGMTTYEGGSAYALLNPAYKKAVVIIQEWWGINDHMKTMANRFAAEGFQAVVPDLYHGKVATDADEATHLMSNLDWPGAIKEIQAAVNYLRSQGATQVFVTGYCMGGALTAASGVLVRGIEAIAPFYGTPPSSLCDLAQTKVPVESHFAGKDAHKGFSDPEAAKAYDAKLETAGVHHKLYMYEKADHAFMNETRPEVFDKQCSDLAFSRVVKFFNQYA